MTNILRALAATLIVVVLTVGPKPASAIEPLDDPIMWPPFVVGKGPIGPR